MPEPQERDQKVIKATGVRHCLDARQFQEWPFPKADPKNNTWLVYTTNQHDGVGDFNHFCDYVLALNEIAKKHGYRVEGVIDLCLPSSNPFRFIQDRLTELAPIPITVCYHALKSEQQIFYERLKQLPHISMFDNIKEALKSQKHTPLQVFHIDSGGLGDHIKQLCESLDNRPLMIHVGEYGMEEKEFFKNKGKFLAGSMGLENASAYGIKISPKQALSKKEKYERLQAFEHTAFKEALLPHFQENALFIGYMQSSVSALGYMLAGIQMKTSASESLNCDFFLDRNSFDYLSLDIDIKQLMTYFTNEIEKAFGPCTLEFVTENPESKSLETVGMGSGPRKIRIFYGIHLPNSDYQALRTLTDNPGGCSGDSTFSDVLGSQGIFYFSSDASHNFTRLFPKQLLKFFKKSNYQEKFPYLYEYCKTNQPYHGSDMDLELDLYSLASVDQDQIQYETHLELGLLLQNPQLHDEWKAFREILIREYNYYEHLPSIAKMGCLLECNDAIVDELCEHADTRESYKKAILESKAPYNERDDTRRAIDEAGSLTDATIIYDEFFKKIDDKPEGDLGLRKAP